MKGLRDGGRKALGRTGVRFATPLGAAAVMAILLFGTGAAAACAPPPSSPPYTVLATIPLVDTIAANSSMVFAQGVANCDQIWGITPAGSVSVYATVPVVNSACDEGGLALAPNTTYTGSGIHHGGGPPPSPASDATFSAAQWGRGHCQCGTSNTTLFDVVAGELFAITQGGTNVIEIATFPISPKPSENMGLAYDPVGTFHHDLIVTSSYQGKVWLVNSTGVVTLLAKLHTYIGGPAVAPMNFGAFGGDLIIAEKKHGSIVAISPSGTVSTVASWSEANGVTFPFTYSGYQRGGWGGWGSWNGAAQWGNGGGGCGGQGVRGCSFGPNHDVMFVANYSSGAVEAFPASDLWGYYPDGFVAGGLNQGIGAFAPSGVTSYFATQTERLSGIASIYCPPPPSCAPPPCPPPPCGGGHGNGS